MSDSKDLRKTKQRKHLYELLKSKKGPMTADQILKNCQLWCPNMALTTVYRNLDRMVELGYVARIQSPQGAARYCSAASEKRINLVCRICNGQELVEDADIKPLEAYVFEKNGFTTELGHLEFLGVCKKCLKQIP